MRTLMLSLFHLYPVFFTVTMTLFLVSSATADLVPLLETAFTDNAQAGRVVKGTSIITNSGMELKKDSRIHYSFKNAEKIHLGNIAVLVQVPEMKDKSALMGLSESECFCAFKIRSGRIEIELSEKWIKAFLYNEDKSRIERELKHVSIPMNPDERRKEIRIDASCDGLRALVNKKELLRLESRQVDLGDIDLTTFNQPFTVEEFHVFAELRDTLEVNKEEGYVAVAAQYAPGQYNTRKGLKNHHFIVWEGGRAGDLAVFNTYIPDSVIYKALVSIGATPGNNLSQEAWTKRTSKSSNEPDKKAKGSPLSISIDFCDSTYTPSDIIEDISHKPQKYRFAGNLDLIPHWRSGCVVCLQSCPGGKIGNATYSIRDLVEGHAQFRLTNKTALISGDEVTLRFAIK